MSEEKQEKPTYNDFTMASLAVKAQPPSIIARMVSIGICAMIFIGVVFAFLAPMDIVVTTQGRAVPTGKSKVIQPLEPGIIRSISVRDGQKVKTGDNLVELDLTAVIADRDRIQRELFETALDVERTNALLAVKDSFTAPKDTPPDILANQQLILITRLSEFKTKLSALEADIVKRQSDRDAIQSNIDQLRNTLALVTRKHEMRINLAKTGHMTETGLIETGMELVNQRKDLSVQLNRLKESEASLVASEQQKALTLAEFRAKASLELTEATKKRDAARQEMVKINQRREQLTLRAPIDGIVQQLAVSTIGGVVTAAQQLMTIVPENSILEIEAQVMNRDIGFLKVGQRVINKVETYDFTRFGYIEGEVQWVGTDAVLDPKLGPVFPVRISLSKNVTPKMVNGRKGEVVAGMNVTADIKTDTRKMIDYFIAPMVKYKEEALRER